MPWMMNLAIMVGAALAAISLSTIASAATLRIHYKTQPGQRLTVRGSAAPLSWDKGIDAREAEPGVWVCDGPADKRTFDFRPYLDDARPSTGASYRVPAGAAAVEVFPYFGPAEGRLVILEDPALPRHGPHGDKRRLLVYLPPSYEENRAKHYPVLYMLDGQNLFDRSTSASTIEWQVDETLARLWGEGRVREAIVVGIDNTPDRTGEYTPMPDRDRGRRRGGSSGQAEGGGGGAFLDWIRQTVKPYIDRRYRTLPGPADTMMMGSSLGGLLSFWAAWTRGDTFGAAGCLSSSFWWNDEAMLRLVRSHRGARPRVRIYMDCGNAKDAAATTGRMRKALRRAGFRDGRDLFYYRDAKAYHSEECWAARLHVPLQALLPAEGEVRVVGN